MKKVVILTNSDTELSNQLWNYISVYAYTLERGYILENPSFFEYGNYFTTPAPNLFLKIFFFLPFANYSKRKYSLRRRIWRKLYGIYANFIMTFNKEAILRSAQTGDKPYYLPPSKVPSEIIALEDKHQTIYLCGWLFRNPVGIEKYRPEIINYFRPRADISSSVQSKINSYRNKYKHVVGVHIRQADYRTWRKGAFFVDQKRTYEILIEYLEFFGKSATETLLVIASDGTIDTNNFSDLNIEVSHANAVEDLFLLSSTDVVIGSDSTFGDFAAYYGNIPHIVMKNEKMDWGYYKEMRAYVSGKYMTWVHF